MGISFGPREAVYLSNFLTELKFEDFNSVPIHCDSTGAPTVAANATYWYSPRTKQTAPRFLFLRELAKDCKITLHFVLTGKMLADCGTKHLAKVQLRSSLQQIKDFSECFFSYVKRVSYMFQEDYSMSELSPTTQQYKLINYTTPENHQARWIPAWRVNRAMTRGTTTGAVPGLTQSYR